MRWLLACLVVPLVAHAEPEASEPGQGSAEEPAPNRFNFRVGAASSDTTGRPTICVDVRVWYKLGVETCGTGQGVIHNEPGTELAHFRTTWSFIEHATSTGTGKLRGGLGFAELQVGVDRPGFHFGQPDAVDRGSVAGPEAMVQGQWLIPIGKGVEAIASFTAGLAVFAHANELVEPKSNAQPFASVEIGLGW